MDEIVTFRELAGEWLAYKRGMVKESTTANYHGLLSYTILPYFGETEVSRFGKADGQKFVGHLLALGKSVKYIRDSIGVLRQLLEYASDVYDMDVPPDFKVKYPTRNVNNADNRVCAYTKDDAAKIIEYCTANLSPRNLGVILAFYTGMRIGELCGLRWEDVDLKERVIHVRRTLQRVHEPGQTTRITLQPPKTAHSYRSIPIAKSIFPMLKEMSRGMRLDYYVLSGSVHPAEPRTYRQYYYNLLRKNVPSSSCLTFHAIRHTFASQLITGGQDVKTVSELLGHSNAAITLAIYTHSNEAAKRKCADALKYY